MLVVGYYTTDSTYQDHAQLLKKSLDRFGIAYDFIEIAPADWLKATAFKPTAILELMEKHQQPVLYLDVDSVVHADVVDYFSKLNADVAAHYKDDHELISSTVYFDFNPNTLALLRRWKEEMARTPEVWDQKVLQNLVESAEFTSITFKKLPPEFTYIFDLTKKAHPYLTPIVEQLQASREGRHEQFMQTPQYKRWRRFGLYPRSTYRMRARRIRLAELAQQYQVNFNFRYEP